MDGAPDVGGRNLASRPMEVMLMGMGGCTAIDVVSMLQEAAPGHRGVEVSLVAERADDHPKVFTEVKLVYTVRGRKLNRALVERAVSLSDEKVLLGHGHVQEDRQGHATRSCWSRSSSGLDLKQGQSACLTGAVSPVCSALLPENVAAGLRALIPPQPDGWTKAYPDTIEKERSREQTREFEVQDRPPPQGQPVGPSQEPDQQARIRSRPARPGPPEADRLSPAVDGEAAASRAITARSPSASSAAIISRRCAAAAIPARTWSSCSSAGWTP
jgi:hypothetical protein